MQVGHQAEGVVAFGPEACAGIGYSGPGIPGGDRTVYRGAVSLIAGQQVEQRRALGEGVLEILLGLDVEEPLGAQVLNVEVARLQGRQ